MVRSRLVLVFRLPERALVHPEHFCDFVIAGIDIVGDGKLAFSDTKFFHIPLDGRV